MGGRPFFLPSLTWLASAVYKINSVRRYCEGFELEVLGGALNVIRKYKPKLIIETHSLSLRKKTEEFLSQFGYTISHEGRGTWVNENGME